MKVVILAGGAGTRISEETSLRPKPMVEIGGKPILWHIMKHYANYGHNDFIICLGFKGYYIKEYFANYFLHQTDVTINLKENKFTFHNSNSEDWNVTLVDTGLNTQTGCRIKKVEKYIDGPFMLTYGDGVSDINLDTLLKSHKSHGGIGTMTSVQPEGRFGNLEISGSNQVSSFIEKPKEGGTWINGGFFVFEKAFLNYLTLEEDLILERRPLEMLTQDKQLFAYKHTGFWKCMDTLRDKNQLESMWQTNNPPWKTWKD
ncbi:MAG: glucose-1-phosphate cytidylyltransferase [Bacteriovoracaceae bacterium]